MGLCFAVLLSVVLASSAVAQNKAKKAAEPDNIQGRVTAIAKDKMTFTVATDTAPRQVMFSASTKFMYGHSDEGKASTWGKVEVNNYISCSGTMDKAMLMATDCVFREKK
jgi:hypothetical protein